MGAPAYSVDFTSGALGGLGTKPHLATDEEVSFESRASPSAESPLKLLMEYTDSYGQRGGIEYDVIDRFELRLAREIQIIAADPATVESDAPGASVDLSGSEET